MHMDDPFIWSQRARQAGRIRWHWGWTDHCAPHTRARGPYRRRLAAMERALTAESPVLASKFSVFNQLTDGERPVGAEHVPAGPVLPRPHPLYLAVLLLLAAFAAVCFSLSAQIRTPARSCPHSEAAASVPAHGLPCPTYPAARQ